MYDFSILKDSIFFFLAVFGLRFCVRAFSSCGKRGPLFIAVHGPLTIAASLVAEHKLQTHRLSSCGARAQSLRGMWDLPRLGLEPVSPALAGGFSTTAPPGKPPKGSIFKSYLILFDLTVQMNYNLYLYWSSEKSVYRWVSYFCPKAEKCLEFLK